MAEFRKLCACVSVKYVVTLVWIYHTKWTKLLLSTGIVEIMESEAVWLSGLSIVYFFVNEDACHCWWRKVLDEFRLQIMCNPLSTICTSVFFAGRQGYRKSGLVSGREWVVRYCQLENVGSVKTWSSLIRPYSSWWLFKFMLRYLRFKVWKIGKKHLNMSTANRVKTWVALPVPILFR